VLRKLKPIRKLTHDLIDRICSNEVLVLVQMVVGLLLNGERTNKLDKDGGNLYGLVLCQSVAHSMSKLMTKREPFLLNQNTESSNSPEIRVQENLYKASQLCRSVPAVLKQPRPAQVRDVSF